MMKLFLSSIIKYWMPLTLVIVSVISFLSLWPLDKLPSVPGTDKTHHIFAYAILVMPASLRRPKNWMYISLFFLLYSGAIEFLQPYVNRHGEWLDMAANAAGIITGIILSELVIRMSPDVFENSL